MKAADDPRIGSSPGRSAPPTGAGSTTRLVVASGWILLAAVYVLPFQLDVRARDAFSWMDPYQYYLFARGVADGSQAFDASAVPSIFPFFVVPLLRGAGSIPAALQVNVVFAAVLAAAVHGLCRRLRPGVPSVLVATAVLTSPLLFGLSRTLYVELSLTALVALGFAALLRWLDTGRGRDLALFAAVLGLGFMVKMTYPAFFLVPLAAIAWCACRARRFGAAVRLGLASVTAVAGVLLVQYVVFPTSFRYYTSLGNTAIPIMRLIGPPDVLSWDSLAYYPRVLATLALALLTPFLLLALGRGRRGGRDAPRRAVPTPSPRALVWLWLLGPVLLLTLQPVKEPRHIAPCVVPAMLLVFDGIASVRAAAARRALATLAVALAALQYAAVALGAVHVPYDLRGSTGHARIEGAMLAADWRGLATDVPPELRWSEWKFRQNVVIAGFGADEALALTWSLFPAVVYDLRDFEVDAADADAASESFEDLYVLTAFNTYNRRAGWDVPCATLGENAVLANADWVLLGPAGDAGDARFAPFEPVGTVATRSGDVRVLHAAHATEAYRTLYARRFLRRHPDLDATERTTVGYELLLTALLERDFEAVPELLRSFPGLADPEARRRIYWMSAYRPLHALAVTRLAEQLPADEH